MPRKGYKPRTSRTKLPLSVEQQRKLVGAADGQEKTLLLLMLSTGMHPKVLAQKEYNLVWDASYYHWNRPKTHKAITGAWSKAMREGDNLENLRKLRGSTRQWYHRMLQGVGRKAKLTGFCPLQARHTNFVNRARLGHNPYDIAMSASTDMQTVYQYYMIGAGEGKGLSPDDRAFLQWLIES